MSSTGKKIAVAALGTAVVVGAAALLVAQQQQQPQDEAADDGTRKRNREKDAMLAETTVERVTQENVAAAGNAAEGNAPENDPLHGSEHDLPGAEAKHVRAAARLARGGKALNEATREPMYDDLSDVGEAGSVGDSPGMAGKNPVGRRQV